MKALDSRLRRALSPVERLLRERGARAWLVGGAVRDAVAGRRAPTLDIDLAVPEDAEALARALARRLGGASFLLHQETQVWRVAVKGPPSAQVDVGRFQGADIGEDLSRRDFTANAMALPLPLGSGPLLDPFGGAADIRRGLLKATGRRVFAEDPLRTLRAFRLGAQLGLSVEPRTASWIKAAAARVSGCAGERVRSELMALLACEDSAGWLQALDSAGLLTAVFPELKASRRCAEVYYGKGGVLKHSLDAVARMDFLLANLDRVYPDLAGDIRSHLAARCGGLQSHQALLRLAVLLHDVAKPATARRIGGRLRFFGHEEAGARTAGGILERLRFSREERETVEAAVRHHLRPGNLAANKAVSHRATFRFFRDLGDHGVSLLLLCWADHASYLSVRSLRGVLGKVRDALQAPLPRSRSGGEDVRKSLYHLRVVSLLLDRYFRDRERVLPPRMLDGHAVMKALKLPPGPEIGALLERLREAQAEGKVRTRAEAITFLMTLHKRPTVIPRKPPRRYKE